MNATGSRFMYEEMMDRAHRNQGGFLETDNLFLYLEPGTEGCVYLHLIHNGREWNLHLSREVLNSKEFRDLLLLGGLSIAGIACFLKKYGIPFSNILRPA